MVMPMKIFWFEFGSKRPTWVRVVPSYEDLIWYFFSIRDLLFWPPFSPRSDLNPYYMIKLETKLSEQGLDIYHFWQNSLKSCRISGNFLSVVPIGIESKYDLSPTNAYFWKISSKNNECKKGSLCSFI